MIQSWVEVAAQSMVWVFTGAAKKLSPTFVKVLSRPARLGDDESCYLDDGGEKQRSVTA